MRTLKSKVTGQVYITVGRRKNGDVALMSDSNEITWFEAYLLDTFEEI